MEPVQAGFDDRGGWPEEHDLADFFREDLRELQAEDKRIRKRSAEDPGTAGDEGESVWRELLARWLSGLPIVTKGRILFPDKSTSAQVDLLVLRPSYPKRLLDKKLYLSSGVLAAFECKNTVTAAHITQAVRTAADIKSKLPRRIGDARGELRPPILFGLLALSHSWKSVGSQPIHNVDNALRAAASDDDPWSLIDTVCLADVAVWTLSHFVEFPDMFGNEHWEARISLGVRPEGQVLSQYTRWCRKEYGNGPAFLNPLAILIAELTMWLAWETLELRPLADYYRMAGLLGQGTGISGSYPLSVLSDEAKQRIRLFGDEGFWNVNHLVIS